MQSHSKWPGLQIKLRSLTIKHNNEKNIKKWCAESPQRKNARHYSLGESMIYNQTQRWEEYGKNNTCHYSFGTSNSVVPFAQIKHINEENIHIDAVEFDAKLDGSMFDKLGKHGKHGGFKYFEKWEIFCWWELSDHRIHRSQCWGEPQATTTTLGFKVQSGQSIGWG